MSSPNSDTARAAGPLAGLRVIDWTHVLAGPFASYQLALLGAEVVRIERTDGDDLIRSKSLEPHLAALGLGDAFLMQGAGKQSLAVNARDPLVQQALHALLSSADVLVENFRPGKLAALGFDPAELIRRHPRLVVCSITGFGPDASERAYDHVIQAASGLMQANASADGTPQRIGFPIVDYAVGQQAALAITTALLRRERTGAEHRSQGEWLQVSMFNAALALMAPVFASELVCGRSSPRTRSTAFSGSPLSGTFAVGGGHLAIVCNAREQTTGLMAALSEGGVSQQEIDRLTALAGHGQVDLAQECLGACLTRHDGATWLELMSRHGVPTAMAVSPIQAVRRVSGCWPRIEVPTESGFRTVAVPGIGFSSTEPLTTRLAPPRPRGADTRHWLEAAGLEPAEIDQLLQGGQAFERTA